MGRPRKTIVEEALEDNAITQSEIDIENFLDQYAPDTVVVEIYQRQKDGSLPHQERVGIEILKADLYGYLRENYDQGKFVLRFKDAMGRVRKALTIDVGPGPKKERSVPVVASNGNGHEVDFNKELMLALIASLRPPPPVDMGALMTGMANMIQANKPAPVANTGQNDIAALMGSMVNVWQSLRPKEEDSLSRFKDMVAITRDLMPDNGGKEESLLSVAKDVAGKVVDVLGGKGAPVAPARPVLYPVVSQPVQLNPVGAETPPPANDVTQEPMLDDSYWLKSQLDYLKKKAAIGKDPLDWVDYILDNQEEPGCQVVVSALRRGATFEHLLHFDDEIGKSPLYMTWFRTFYNELRNELLQDVDTQRAGGNQTDPGSDAGAGAVGQPETPRSTTRGSTT